ncbi:MAG: hypothetical protein U0231_13790 [Nitrospiraceae bacterium]
MPQASEVAINKTAADISTAISEKASCSTFAQNDKNVRRGREQQRDTRAHRHDQHERRPAALRRTGLKTKPTSVKQHNTS